MDLWEDVGHCDFCGFSGPFNVILTAKDIYEVFKKGASLQKWQLVECPECTLRFITPRWSLEHFKEHLKSSEAWTCASNCYQFGNFVKPDGLTPDQQKAHLQLYYRAMYSGIRHLISAAHPRVIDVGSNVAWALKTFTEMDADRAGSLAVDVDPEACRINREIFKLNSICSPVEALPSTTPGGFDFVHCNDFIEHTHTPHADLRTMRRLARDGAAIWLKTFVEDLDEPAGRTMLAPYGHHFHFSIHTLRRALECAGWQPVRWEATAGVQYIFVCIAA